MKIIRAAPRLEILKAISDTKSLMLFNSIAKGHEKDIEVHLGRAKVSRKEYYSRAARFVKTGLVNRKQGRYLLYAFRKSHL